MTDTASTVAATAPNANEPDLFAAFATDEVAEEQGTWSELPNAGATKFLITRTGNKEYGKLFRKLYKRNERALKAGGDHAEKVAVEMDIELIVKVLLKGWDKPINFKGQMLSYSEDNARLLAEHKGFRSAVKAVSESEDAYKAIKDEEIEGN